MWPPSYSNLYLGSNKYRICMYHLRQCTVPAVNDSHTPDFVVMITLQHLGHSLCSDCPVNCGYTVNSYDLTITYLSTILSVHTSGSVACLHLFHIIKPTCADCEKPREDSKVGSHQGARRGVFLHLNSHEMQISYFVWNHIWIRPRSTLLWIAKSYWGQHLLERTSYLARLHDAEIGFRDRASKDW